MHTQVIVTLLALSSLLLIGCTGGNGPSGTFQEDGAFILKTPPVNDSTFEGYTVLDDRPDYFGHEYDVRLYKYFYGDSVYIRSGLNGGGILPGTGNRAPDYPYETIYKVNFQWPLDFPLQFFLLCRDNLHYCKLMLDSIKFADEYDTDIPDTVNTCTGYFRYTLNLEEGERDF
jgi:hypothetical protein